MVATCVLGLLRKQKAALVRHLQPSADRPRATRRSEGSQHSMRRCMLLFGPHMDAYEGAEHLAPAGHTRHAHAACSLGLKSPSYSAVQHHE